MTPTPQALRELASRCTGRMIIGANVAEINAALTAVADELERPKPAEPVQRFATAEDIATEESGIKAWAHTVEERNIRLEVELETERKARQLAEDALVAVSETVRELGEDKARLESELAVAVESAARASLQAEAAGRELAQWRVACDTELEAAHFARDAAVKERDEAIKDRDELINALNGAHTAEVGAKAARLDAVEKLKAVELERAKSSLHAANEVVALKKKIIALEDERDDARHELRQLLSDAELATRSAGGNAPAGVVGADRAYEAAVAAHNAAAARAAAEEPQEIDALTRATLDEPERPSLLGKAAKAIGELFKPRDMVEVLSSAPTAPSALERKDVQAIVIPKDTSEEILASLKSETQPTKIRAVLSPALSAAFANPADELALERHVALHAAEAELGRLEAAHHERRTELMARIATLRALLGPQAPVTAPAGPEGAPSASDAPKGAPDA